MRSVWNGSLSFGFVDIPVQVFSAHTTPSQIRLKTVDSRDNAPLGTKTINKTTGEEVPASAKAKAYDDIIITSEELESIAIQPNKTIEVDHFVQVSQIPHHFFDKPYFVRPQTNSKGYWLLYDLLYIESKAAMVMFTLQKKRYPAAIIAHQGALMLLLLRERNGVATGDALDIPERHEIQQRELEFAIQLSNSMTKDFDVEFLVDEYQDRLRDLISRKAAGKPIKLPKLDYDPHTFQPMLAHRFGDHEHKVTFPVYAQPKLDGVRCHISAKGAYSRHGRKFESCGTILSALSKIFKAHPDLVLDGELYGTEEFYDTAAMVKSRRDQQDLDFHIFDCPSHPGTFSERIAFLKSLGLTTVETVEVESRDDLDALYSDWCKHYEGQMVRLDTRYYCKRTSSLLKRKPFVTEEFLVLDVVPGQGKREGTVGALILQAEGGTFTADIAASDKVRRELFQEDLVGEMATVKHAGYTHNQIPRRGAVVVAIRDYERI